MDFFVSYSERDADYEQLVSQALAPYGTITGRAAVETGGLELIQTWAAERGGSPSVVICVISSSYLARGGEIANAVLRADSLVWIDVCLERIERSPAALLRPSISLEGLDREQATVNLEFYFDALLGDPDLFSPMLESGSLGMTSRGPDPLSLGELVERRERAESYQTGVSALEAPTFETPSAAPPMAPPQAQPLPPPPQAARAAGSRDGLIRWLLIGGAVLVAAVALKGWLAELLAGAGVVTQGMVQPVPPQTGRVDVSAFAPGGGRPGEKVLVQVLLHAQADLRRARREVRLADPEAARRMTTTLTQDIAPGQLVTVMVEGDGVAVQDSVQHIIWRGEPVAAQFLTRLPSDLGYTYLRCRLFVDKVPVGSLRFGLRVSEGSVAPKPEMQGDSARRYERAFLSYASADRTEVLKRLQGLRAAGIKVFQDVLSLEPGEKWEQRLYDEIDRCDLFVLFWSSNAAKSEWVTREIERAVARQRASEGTPEITPVIIEAPPASPIPASLRYLHFNDFAILAAMSEPRQ